METELMPKVILLEIIKHWEKMEDLCKVCEPYWAALTTAQRREIRHDHDFEKED